MALRVIPAMAGVVIICVASTVALAGAASSKQTPSIVTQLSTNTVQAGGFVHDTASLDGAVATAGGTVTYSYFTNDACTAGQVTVDTVDVTDGAIPDSALVTFPSAGTFFWQAVYSGDSNDVGASSPCPGSNSEELIVTPSPSSSTPTSTPPSSCPSPSSSPSISTPTSTSPPPSPRPSIGIRELERGGPEGQFTRGPLTGTIGETIFYKMIVRDTGNTTLNVTLRDPICDSGTIIPSGTQVIASGHASTYLCLHELTSVSSGNYVLRDTATATGMSPQGVKVGPVRSSVVVKVGALLPAPKPKPIPKPANFTG